MQQLPPGPAIPVEDDDDSRPASSAHEQEQEQDQMLPEEAVPPSVTNKRNKVVLDLHANLSPHFPSHFHHEVVDVPFYEEQPPAASLLIVDPDLSRTWLRPPPAAGDSHGYWAPSSECKLPPNRSHLFPPGAKGKPLGKSALLLYP